MIDGAEVIERAPALAPRNPTGGYLFYDSTKPLPASAFRTDIHVIGMPATAICNATYDVPRERTLFKNILVLGALSELMGIEAGVIEKLFAEQYKGKERLLDSNVRALHAGREFARDHLGDALGLLAAVPFIVMLAGEQLVERVSAPP